MRRACERAGSAAAGYTRRMEPTGTADVERPLRRDAARNRDLLLAAAREAFGECGVDVPLEEIARRAGVGIATLYRRFPRREDLLGAVAEDVIAEYAGVAEAALAEPDPWDGVAALVVGAGEIQARDRARRAVLAAGLAHAPAAVAEEARARLLVRRIVERGQAAGVVRADLEPEDVYLVLWGSSRVIEVLDGIAPDAWRRFLGLILDGLRAGPSASPLPSPALLPGEVDTALAGLRGGARGPRAGA